MSQSEKDPNTLEVMVFDEVGVAGVGPDGQSDKEPSREEIMRKVLERKVELASKYVKPHNKVSRPVTQDDLKKVIEDANIMSEMCLVGRGEYTVGAALAHSQFNDTEPLRFYVRSRPETGHSEIIINPYILGTGGDVMGANEGCMSYPEEPMKTVFRHHQVKLRFQTIHQKVDKETGERVGEPFLTEPITKYFNGYEARVIQHEVTHLNGKNIYDTGHSAADCVCEVPKNQ